MFFAMILPPTAWCGLRCRIRRRSVRDHGAVTAQSGADHRTKHAAEYLLWTTPRGSL